VQLLTHAVELDQGLQQAYVGRGAAYLKSGYVEDSIADFNRVLKMDPMDERTYHMRGIARARMCDNHHALQDLDMAVWINPEYGAAYYSRARFI
jgi:tetratricopeptide (TPR) repeat protein